MMKYIINLKESNEAYGNRCLTVTKLAKVGVEPVPNPFCVRPEVFEKYLTHDKLPNELYEELKEVYRVVSSDGYTANIRTSDIECPTHPNLNYVVSNRMFIQDYESFVENFEQRYKAIKEAVLEYDVKQIQVSTLIHSTYDSHKCGITQTDDGYGNIRIEAAWGQTTNIFSRDDIDPDVYILKKPTLEIIEKKIGRKDYEWVYDHAGFRKEPVSEDKITAQVFDDNTIKRYGEYALSLEKEYGPQEFECAVTTNEVPLVQETRNMSVTKMETAAEGVGIVFPGVVDGIVHKAGLIEDLPADATDKIIVSNNINIDFITILVYKYRPKAVILMQGTITAHASTILREAKIVSYIIKEVELKDGEKIRINSNGSIERI